MLRCQQVNRNEVWIRIPVCVEIDGRFDVGPFCLRYRRISMQEIIESQTGPPRDCTPTLHAHDARNLVMDLVVCEKSGDVERSGQAGGQPIESQTPLRNISRIWRRAVVIVLERSNLRLTIRGYQMMLRIKSCGHIIVELECFVQKPFVIRSNLNWIET